MPTQEQLNIFNKFMNNLASTPSQSALPKTSIETNLSTKYGVTINPFEYAEKSKAQTKSPAVTMQMPSGNTFKKLETSQDKLRNFEQKFDTTQLQGYKNFSPVMQGSIQQGISNQKQKDLKTAELAAIEAAKKKEIPKTFNEFVQRGNLREISTARNNLVRQEFDRAGGGFALNREHEQKEAMKDAYEFGKESPLLAATTKVMGSPVAGMSALLGTTKQAIQGKSPNPYAPEMYTQNVSNSMLAGVLEGKGGLPKFAIQTVVSAAESALSLSFGPLALAALGTNAAGGTALASLDRGASPQRALINGAVSGAIEVVTEKIGIDNLFALAKNPSVSFGRALVSQAGANGLEEFISQYANYFTDNAIMGNLSEYNLYIKEMERMGHTRESAERAANYKFLVAAPFESLVGGALSGVAFGTGGYAASKLANTSNTVNMNMYENPANNVRVAENISIPDETQKFLGQVAAKAGVNIEVKPVTDMSGNQMLNAEGYFDRATNTIVFSPESTKADIVKGVAMHELTHKIETSEFYGAYRDFALNMKYGGDTAAFSSDIESKINAYAGKGVQLDKLGAEKEIIAEFTRTGFFADEVAVNKLVREQPNLAVRIYESIVEAINKLKTYFSDSEAYAQMKELEAGRKLFEMALGNGGAKTFEASANVKGGQYLIETFPDGRKYTNVTAGKDLFDGKDVSEYNSIARKVILEKFRNKVLPTGEKGRAYVNKASAEEYGYPAKRLKDEVVKNAKMRASSELDNLLSTSEFLGHENDDGRHPDAVRGWDNYRTVFKVGDKYFEGEIKVKKIERGDLFYDITKIKDITDVTRGQYGQDPQAADIGNTSNDILTQSDPSVKTEMQIALEKAGVDSSIFENSEKDTRQMSIKDNANKSRDGAARQLSDKLLGHYRSGYDADTLSTEISTLFREFQATLIDGNGTHTEAELGDMLRETAESILKETNISTESEGNAELLSTLRNTGISIGKTNKGDLSDSFNDFRKRNFGRLKIVNDGVPVDTFYKELSELYPQYFNDVERPAQGDQLQHLAELINELKTPAKQSLAGDKTEIQNISRGILGAFMKTVKPEKSAETSKKLSRFYEGVNALIGFTDGTGKRTGYSTPMEYWSAQRKNGGTSNEFKSLKDITEHISKAFELPISTGKIEQRNALGVHKIHPDTVRQRVANSIPVTAYELGHFLDKKYQFRQMRSVSEAVSLLRNEFKSNYQASELSGEGVAEFLRLYLTDRTTAMEAAPNFYKDFSSKLSTSDLSELNKIGNWINSYMHSESDEKLKSFISFDTWKKPRPTVEGIETALDTTYTRMVDKFNPIKYFDDAVERASGRKLSDSERVYVKAMNTLKDDGKVKYIIEEGMIDAEGKRVDGSSLADILRGINRPEFSAYLMAKHAIEWLTPDADGNVKRVVADDRINNLQEMKRQAESMEIKNPEFKQRADELYKFQRDIMQHMLVDTGIITQKQADALWEKYPNYVPFFRDLDNNGVDGARQGFGNQNSPIKGARGSGLNIIDPIIGIIYNADKFVKTANRNGVMQALVRAYYQNEGLGMFLEEVPQGLASQIQTSNIISKLSKGLAELDIDITQSALDDILGDTIISLIPKARQSQDIISVLIDGEKKYFQFHNRELLRAVANMTPMQMGGVIDTVNAVTRTFKTLTTGSNPFFTIGSNVWRDVKTAYTNSEEINPYTFTREYLEAYRDILTDSDAYKNYKAAGNQWSSSVSANRNALKKIMHDIGKVNANDAEKIMQALLHPIWSIEAMTALVETVPRLADFKRTHERTGSVDAASYAASEATTNFQRHGEIGKQIDAFVPFFNASLQGVDKLVRQAKADPKGLAVKTIVPAIIMGVLQYALNRDEEDWEKLSKYRKNNYYLFGVGGGKYIGLPKSKEYAAFDSFVERAIDYSVRQDKEAFDGFSDYLWDVFVPPLFSGGLADVTLIGTGFEIAGNKNFTGSPIVPKSMENLEPWAQYDEQTSFAARLIGKAFGISPKIVDHAINRNTGWAGAINKAVGAEKKDLTLGMKNKFVIESAYSTDVMNNFYDRRDELKKRHNTHKNDGLSAYDSYRYDAMSSDVSEMFKLVNKESDVNRKAALRHMALDAVKSFEEDISPPYMDKLITLYERTGERGMFPYATTKSTITGTYNGKEYELGLTADEYVQYSKDVRDTINTGYTNAFGKGLESRKPEEQVKILEKIKAEAKEAVTNKYKNRFSDRIREVKKDYLDMLLGSG